MTHCNFANPDAQMMYPICLLPSAGASGGDFFKSEKGLGDVFISAPSSTVVGPARTDAVLRTDRAVLGAVDVVAGKSPIARTEEYPRHRRSNDSAHDQPAHRNFQSSHNPGPSCHV